MDERREKERIKNIRDKHPHLVGDALPHNHTIREIVDIAPFIESVQTTVQAEITDGHDHDGSNSVKVDWGDLDNRPSTFPPDDHDHVVSDISDFPATMPPSSHSHPTSEISDYPSEFPPEDHDHELADITDYVEPEQGLRPSDLFGIGKEGYVIDPWELTENKGAASGYASLDSSSLVVQNPANAQTTAAASKIPISNASGKIDDAWIEPAGSTTQIQFNDGGALAGDANLTWNNTAKTLTVKGSQSTATLGSELLTNGSFDTDLSSWTAGAGWAWASGGKAQHTEGNTETLAQSISTTADASYVISVTVSGRTAGSFTLQIGTDYVYYDGELTAFTASVSNKGYTASTTGSVAVTITPLTTFDGAIDSISIKPVSSYFPEQINIKDSGGGDSFQCRGNSTNLFLGNGTGKNIYSAGTYNLGIGYGTLGSAVGTTYEVGIGYNVLKKSQGKMNVGIGYSVLENSTYGYGNAGIGYQALKSCLTAYNCMALGRNALYTLTSSSAVVGLGAYAGFYCTGNDSVFIGSFAGYNSAVTGSGHVMIGTNAGRNSSATGDNLLYIANSNTTTPLILGNFSTGLLTIHNDLKVNTKFGLGLTPIARRSHVADPSGGSVIDAEARTAINAILATIEAFGFHATS